jgi:hypothetical protein
MQTWVCIAYNLYFYCLFYVIHISKISRIIQIDVLIRHVFQGILQYALIRIYNKHTQVRHIQ